MASLFGGIGGNPLATPIGILIDQATDGSLASENWALNMEICDMINETEEGPKDAVKAIKKKLSTSSGKASNYTVIMYTLTVAETCVKNCGKRFHSQLAHKDFIQEMIKIISPKNDPPTVVQEKILALIQTWADAFRGQSDLKEVEKMYQELKKKGIEFPMTDLDSMAPIHTPARTAYDPHPVSSRPAAYAAPPERQPSQAQVPVGGGPVVPHAAPPAMQPPPQPVPEGPVHLSPEQLSKLRSELDVVQQNFKVFSEMLTELNPGQEDTSDWDLLQELNRTCRTMQQRVVELIDRVANEEVTGELLQLNDNMNNVFLRYERFERYRSGQAGTQPAPATLAQQSMAGPPAMPARGAQPAAPASIGNLIDLDAPAPTQFTPQALTTTQQNMANVSINADPPAASAVNGGSTAGDDEFDMFAASRQSFDTNLQNKNASGYAPSDQVGNLSTAVTAKSTGDTVSRPSDYDEMESWLRTNPKEAANVESATSSEFDDFLAQRAREGDQLPDINATNSRAAGSRGGRQMATGDEQDNALFSL